MLLNAFHNAADECIYVNEYLCKYVFQVLVMQLGIKYEMLKLYEGLNLIIRTVYT